MTRHPAVPKCLQKVREIRIPESEAKVFIEIGVRDSRAFGRQIWSKIRFRVDWVRDFGRIWPASAVSKKVQPANSCVPQGRGT